MLKKVTVFIKTVTSVYVIANLLLVLGVNRISLRMN